MPRICLSAASGLTIAWPWSWTMSIRSMVTEPDGLTDTVTPIATKAIPRGATDFRSSMANPMPVPLGNFRPHPAFSAGEAKRYHHFGSLPAGERSMRKEQNRSSGDDAPGNGLIARHALPGRTDLLKAGLRILCVVALATFASLPLRAQGYPVKPVTFITPAAAGSSPDVITRLVADRLTQLWKRQIVVLNRPGAGGLIAAQAAAGVEKDGYTLYVTQASTFTVLPITQEGKMQVDLQKAFVPIGVLSEQPIAIAVNKDIPARNVAELIGLINKTPGGVQFAAT